MRFLVTGANGFIGRPLCAALFRQGYVARAAVRQAQAEESEQAVIGQINGQTDWSAALQDVDIVIHLAARVHVMKDTAADPLAEFRQVNLHGAENLARQAACAGVKRLVLVSSIKVNGEETVGLQSYTGQDTPAPQDPYGISKYEAEQALQRISSETGLEVVALRPPLVYGPGVKGNFIRLVKAIDRGIPLPLAGAINARSLIYVGNLVDALIACATLPAAAGQTYTISDGQAISTAELVEQIARSLGRSSRSFYLPPTLIRITASLFGCSDQFNRLFGSMRVDDGKIRRELGWAPPYTLLQGLSATMEWYRGTR